MVSFCDSGVVGGYGGWVGGGVVGGEYYGLGVLGLYV